MDPSGKLEQVGEPTKPKKGSRKIVEKQKYVFGTKRRQTRYYSVDDKRKGSGRKIKRNPTKLRSSIKPGTILVLVSTKYRGKRVVFLKQLVSGLLLVVGPYGINGVPLCRVDQCHVIATSTQLDISNVKIPERIDDNYFRHRKVELKKKIKQLKQDIFVEEQEKKSVPNPLHIEDGKEIEAQLKCSIDSIPEMKAYLKTPFSISNGVFPHNLAF
ncbi:hypothetical protein MXB_2874 [Myxobolus squamalis]|nr:hypothetical protein MXB_2874 [Myxobolus squamalis]